MTSGAKKFEDRIYKYATGQAPPGGSRYLSTVTQTSIEVGDADRQPNWMPCWLVWHYFLVQVEVPS